MALDEKQGDGDREDLTAEDNEMLEKVLEVAGSQAIWNEGDIEFSKPVVFEGRKYQMVVTVEMTCTDEGED